MGNRTRYIISISFLVATSVSMVWLPPVMCILAVLLLLYTNNVIDDYVFYYWSKRISQGKYHSYLCSPVNGVVTNIECGVPLMSHILKCDCLTKEVILELKHHQSKKLYNHITIFLNKFNKHIVTNIGSPVKSIKQYNPKTNKYCMVEDGLVPKENGKYLTNPFVRVDYENGVVCVFTLDKYVSEIILNEHHAPYGVDMFICRGSQCDMYIPVKYDFCPSYGETVNNYDRISFIPCESVDISNEAIVADASTLIKASGITARKIMLQNIPKTFGVFKNTSVPYIICLYIGGVIGFPLEVIAAFLVIFAFHRFYKNYLYAEINKRGLFATPAFYKVVEKTRNYLIKI